MDSSYPDSSNLVSSCGFSGVCRKQTKSKNFRKRYLDEDQEEDSGSETILFNKKKSLIHDNKLHICSKKSHGETNENQTVFQFESSSETHVENDSRATTEMNFRVVTGGLHGPLKGSNNIRVSTRFDYQLDICKDYKETGYCGYGDLCKFMHDRGDYKSGWQMEKEWDENDKARKRKLALKEFDVEEDVEQSDDEDDDLLPYACLICRQPFVDPVVTKCKYYFCEHCALKHHEKNKTCFVCNTPTLGIFNTAHEIRKKMTAEGKTCLILYICSTLCMYLLSNSVLQWVCNCT